VFENIGVPGRMEMIRGFLTFLISTAMHFLVILFLVIVPLIFFNALPEVDLLTFLIAAPPPPAPLPEPPPPLDERFKVTTQPIHIVTETYGVPDKIPIGIPVADDEPMVITPMSFPAGQTGVIGMVPGTSAIGLAVLNNATPIEKMPPPPPPMPITPTRVGGDVQQSKLLVKVTPEYPELARRARISGNVVLEIRVDEEGNITEVKVLSGHPLLVDAALKAAGHWKYSPTLLNGEPVPVISTVTMVFHLQ
jgi:periplasmic protein TonB